MIGFDGLLHHDILLALNADFNENNKFMTGFNGSGVGVGLGVVADHH
jgi:hypothetical protein